MAASNAGGSVPNKSPARRADISWMKSAKGAAVRNCPSSSWRLLGFSMAAIFTGAGYQTQIRFTIEQTGVVFSFDGFVFREEREADGNAAKHRRWCSPGAGQSLALRP